MVSMLTDLKPFKPGVGVETEIVHDVEGSSAYFPQDDLFDEGKGSTVF